MKYLLLCMGIMMSQLAAVDVPQSASVEIDGLGNMVAVWAVNKEDGSSVVMASKCASTDSSWSTPSQISVSNTAAQSGPRSVINSSGVAAVVWKARDLQAQVNRIYATTIALSAGGTWTPAVAVSGADEIAMDQYTIRVNSLNQAVLIWQSNSAGTDGLVIKSSTSTLDGSNSWSVPVTVSD
ncbi:MAG: hypothetical protein JSR37_03515 [Verrucomicrobia bacterium]|nr:hypothetical protein [Verrucomicrobiota bacterium]MBS0637819.1 hypothetical protein [Verrucomicrobiota bacterium]